MENLSTADLFSSTIKSIESSRGKETLSAKASFLELCERAFQEYSRPHVIKPYLQDIAQSIDQEDWKKALAFLDELEELFDLDLSS